MSFSYRFVMATPSSAVDVAGRFWMVGMSSGVFEPSTMPDDVLHGAGTRLGTWIRVSDMNPEPWNPVVEELGLTPTVSFAFRLGKDHEIHLQQDDMIRVVSGLLAELSGDAVLHLHYECIWLVRRGGDLIVSDNDDWWRPQRLAMIPSPYGRAALAFAE